MAEPLTLKDHSTESQNFTNRVVVGFSMLLVLTAVLLGRLFYLQILQHDVYTTLSDKNRIHIQSLPPTRGLIYDRNGELIADNIPAYALTIVRERAGDMDHMIEKLSKLVSINERQKSVFENRLKRPRRPFESVPLRFKLSEEEIARISVNRFQLPGVEVEAQLVRHYHNGALMAHAVGSVRRINEADMRKLDPIAYSGTDHIGKIGVERFYESSLLGKVGYRRVETNAQGKVMKILDETPPVPGANITLNVDARLQSAAMDALEGRRGAVVALEPATGAVLALVSSPSYDPNMFVSGIDQKTYGELRDSIDVPLFNRAVQGQYEPGSTLKPFLALAALEKGIVTPDFTINDPGWYRLPNSERLYRDWNWKKNGTGGHGLVHLQKAIYRSCNVYFYELAVKMGIETISGYLKLFGFGEKTVLDLPEVRSGLLPSPEWKKQVRGEPWYPGDTVNMGIGQGSMLVTPFQLATAISVLANRGRWVQPRMLKTGAMPTADTGVHLADVPQVSRKNWETVIEAMSMVVHRGNQVYGENGTAWAYIGRDIKYKMAGKSGTAQVVGIKQGEVYEEEELDERLRKHAWFVAFAPIDDPKIALAVLIENGGGGSEFAAPVAKRIIDAYLLRD